jgi:hypothetical protein
MRKLYESLDLFVESNQSRIQVIKILAGQVTGYQNTSTCRALPWTQYPRGDCADIFRGLSMVEKKIKNLVAYV